MTIQGAVYELEHMMLRDDIPDYIKPTIKKVIETVVDEYNEILKAVPNKVLDKIRTEIEELKPNNPNFKGYFEQNVALNKALEIIDKYKEGKDNG